MDSLNISIRRPTAWYMLIFVDFLLFSLLILMFINYLDLEFMFTNNLPTSSPGQLTDEKTNQPLYWVLIVVSFFGLLTLMFGILRVVISENTPTMTMQFFVTGIFLLSAIINFIFHSFEYEACNNSPSDFHPGTFNLCNDILWCCVYWEDAPEACPALSVGCSPLVLNTTLVSNHNFLMSYSISVFQILLALGMLLFGCFVGKGYYKRRYRTTL